MVTAMTAENGVRLATLVSDGFLTSDQVVKVADRCSKGIDKVLTAIEKLVPIKSMDEQLYNTAIAALLGESTNSELNTEFETKPVDTVTCSKLVPDTEVQEAIVVCIDVSGSMSTPFERDPDPKIKDRTRLDAVKQMFYGFRDQTTNYKCGSKHLLGLISYNDKVVVHTDPTSQLDVFEDTIDDLSTGGMTAIYSAIATGTEMLKQIHQQHPDADLRVLCLSDGLNNCNDVTAQQALDGLQEIGATLDGFIVGDSPDTNLLKIVTASEGMCFQIDCLADGYECLESPAVISLKERRNGAPKPVKKEKKKIDLENTEKATICKGAVVQRQSTQTIAWTKSLEEFLGERKPVTGSQKRIFSEMARIDNRGIFRLFPGGYSADRVDFLKILMLGAEKTPYENGIFELMLTFPDDYPMSPPSLSVRTPIYHYAVSTSGHICLPILYDLWSPANTVAKVLQDVEGLVMTPEITDPTCNLSQRSWLSELKRCEPNEYYENAVKATSLEASAANLTLEERAALLLR